jgi:hypothetical protein
MHITATGLILVLLVGAITVAWRPHRAAGGALQPEPTAVPTTPRPRSTRAQGIPAIPPTQAGVPAFTEEDVRSYALTPPPGYTDPSYPPPRFEFVEFLTEGELRQRFRTETGRLDEELLVLVRWSGHFLVWGPGGPPTAYASAAHVFDASTGYLLLEIIGPSNPCVALLSRGGPAERAGP